MSDSQENPLKFLPDQERIGYPYFLSEKFINLWFLLEGNLQTVIYRLKKFRR